MSYIKAKNHTNEGIGKEEKKERGGKERTRRKKGGGEKKAMVALLVFIMATLDIVFGRKKLLGVKGRFGANVFKNPGRYILPRIMLISYL